MDGFEKRRNTKKEAILRTALVLFEQYGFDKVTVSEIAEKARVSKVSIYNFFESKDNIRRIILKEILDKALAKKSALLEGGVDFKEKIRVFLKLQTEYYGNYSLKLFFDAVETDTVIHEFFNEYIRKNREIIMRVIDEGKQAGFFSSDLSYEAVNIYIDCFQFYFMHNAEIHKKLEHNQKLVEELNVLFLDGLIRQK
jgi:AcrR family transcriptional regulator